jgi:lysophospholipase L1-like esterase
MNSVTRPGMRSWLAVAMIVVAGSVWAADAPSGVAVKNGDAIAFLGDSITAQGAGPRGYVTLVAEGLKANGIEVKVIPAGISGHKSNQMLARVDKDVLDRKPTWMTLSCGVNDVWHGAKGVPLDAYKTNIATIVEKAQAAGVKVMILTSTMIRETQTNEPNQNLIPYNAYLRTLAAEKKCLLADLNAEMQKAVAELQKSSPGNVLTGDGVHMNPLGNKMMARGVLKAFGLNDAQMKLAEDAWLKMPPPPAPAPKVTAAPKVPVAPPVPTTPDMVVPAK